MIYWQYNDLCSICYLKRHLQPHSLVLRGKPIHTCSFYEHLPHRIRVLLQRVIVGNAMDLSFAIEYSQ